MEKAKENIKRDAPDLAEPFLDEVTNAVAEKLFHEALPELAKDLPVIKYFSAGADLYGTYKVHKLRKRMAVFLKSLIDGKFDVEAYGALEQEEKEAMIDIVVTELDNQTDNLQSEALGLLFVAYIQKKIDRLAFLGIAHELKNTNPLAFYFNMDSIVVREKFKAKELAVSGPVHYLPSSFYSNGTDKLQFSSDGPFLTNLGKAFYENVYKPMAQRYMI